MGEGSAQGSGGQAGMGTGPRAARTHARLLANPPHKHTHMPADSQRPPSTLTRPPPRPPPTRAQKETNTKIAIRGRGSVKEGASRDPK